MSDKLAEYRHAELDPIPEKTRLWPLYGAGFDNLGMDSKPIEVELPHYGPDELLVRHDACGLCFSDIKILSLGETHPRIFKDMKVDPVVMGHEVVMTLIGIGENLKDTYHVGQRFIVQADIYDKGVNYAYGYMLQGGLSEYAVIGKRVLNGDDGSYLIPIREETGYVESALVEPWACVIAAYELKYRTGIKNGGTTWIVGSGEASDTTPYTLTEGFQEQSHPAKLALSNVPAKLSLWLKERAAQIGVHVIDIPDIASTTLESVDDIIVLGADAEVVEKVSPKLGMFGILAVVSDKPFARNVSIDVGRVHYNRWVYVGTKGSNISRAYSDTPVRSTLRTGGKTWLVGAGGPIGRMHLQRAIEIRGGPGTIVCTDVSDARLEDLRVSFEGDAKIKNINLVCLNPTKKEEYNQRMGEIKAAGGFDDIIVLAPIAAVISDSATYLSPKGVMNVFAGVNRGTMSKLNLNDMLDKDVRVIGHSASSLDDMKLMLRDTEAGILKPNRSVAAVGSLEAAKVGLQALKDATYPGKVVIFPNIKYLPITSLPELKDKLPTVFAKLKNGREWCVEAEQEFLRIMLP
jgi:threonine dehydrogenase-like Zn-dependent dehydrogenase